MERVKKIIKKTKSNYEKVSRQWKDGLYDYNPSTGTFVNRITKKSIGTELEE